MSATNHQNVLRQTIFDALAALFLQPDEDDTCDRWMAGLEAAIELAESLGLSTASYAVALSALPEPDDVAKEFTRLFLEVDDPLPLAESAWLYPGEIPISELECRKAYMDAGLETAGLLGVPADHLGFEFGFMTVLLLKDNIQTASDFFASHPAKWLPDLVTALRARQDTPFFRTVADVLHSVMAIEAHLRNA